MPRSSSRMQRHTHPLERAARRERTHRLRQLLRRHRESLEPVEHGTGVSAGLLVLQAHPVRPHRLADLVEAVAAAAHDDVRRGAVDGKAAALVGAELAQLGLHTGHWPGAGLALAWCQNACISCLTTGRLWPSVWEQQDDCRLHAARLQAG
jgi:hypothetical protein